MRWKTDFKSNQSSESFYDLIDDFDLLESSFAQQYNIRLRKEISTMAWGEFSSYVSGLNTDTPLGNVVRIRSEKDPKKLKSFTKSELKIRNEWVQKHKKQMSKEDFFEVINNFQEMFKKMSKRRGD